MTATSSAVARVAGTALPLVGDDVDTDRIIPARYLRSITFEGLERGAFADDRKAAAAAGTTHPFDDPAFAGASFLVVNRNFGCGSSREHAPQALARFGIRAVLGESFAEIFFGNSVALGLPCVTLPRDVIHAIQSATLHEPARELVLDLDARTVTAFGAIHPAGLPDAIRHAFLTGQWDGTSLLLADFHEVRAVDARLRAARTA